MINKRGQVGSGISWFVATIVIFMITVMFLFMAGLISGVTGISGTSNSNARSVDASVDSVVLGEQIARTNLMNFMNSEILPGIKVVDYIFGFSQVTASAYNETLYHKAHSFFKGQSDWKFYVGDSLVENNKGTYVEPPEVSKVRPVTQTTNFNAFYTHAYKGSCNSGRDYAYFKLNGKYVWLCVGGGK